MKNRGAAALLLLGGCAAQFAWKHIDAPSGAVWNASQALLLVLVITLLGVCYRRSLEMVAVCALLAVVQGLTAYCHIAWAFKQWKVLPGQGICSAKFDMPLGAIACAIFAWIAIGMLDRMRKEKSGGDLG